MKLKAVILFFCLALLPSQILCDDVFKQKFNELLTKGDLSGQEKLLDEWATVGNTTPEFYISYFNYCVKNCRQERMSTGDSPSEPASLKLTGKSETGEDIVAYMNFEISYDKKILDKGFDMIAKGIRKYPDRLDMRFGEIYMYGETGDYDKFTSKIVQTINYSSRNDNQWMWDNSELLENSKEFVLGAVQQYQSKLYNTGNDDLLNNMKQIAETVLKYYPDNVESLSNLSLVYSLREEYGKALEVLAEAEKNAPKDCIVLNNIAHIYKITGDTQKSLKYYKLIIKYGDAEHKKLAIKQINGLVKK